MGSSSFALCIMNRISNTPLILQTKQPKKICIRFVVPYKAGPNEHSSENLQWEKVFFLLLEQYNCE